MRRCSHRFTIAATCCQSLPVAWRQPQGVHDQGYPGEFLVQRRPADRQEPRLGQPGWNGSALGNSRPVVIDPLSLTEVAVLAEVEAMVREEEDDRVIPQPQHIELGQ